MKFYVLMRFACKIKLFLKFSHFFLNLRVNILTQFFHFKHMDILFLFYFIFSVFNDLLLDLKFKIMAKNESNFNFSNLPETLNQNIVPLSI